MCGCVGQPAAAMYTVQKCIKSKYPLHSDRKSNNNKICIPLFRCALCTSYDTNFELKISMPCPKVEKKGKKCVGKLM